MLEVFCTFKVTFFPFLFSTYQIHLGTPVSVINSCKQTGKLGALVYSTLAKVWIWVLVSVGSLYTLYRFCIYLAVQYMTCYSNFNMMIIPILGIFALIENLDSGVRSWVLKCKWRDNTEQNKRNGVYAGELAYCDRCFRVLPNFAISCICHSGFTSFFSITELFSSFRLLNELFWPHSYWSNTYN